jgi:hypothetical protein
LKENIEEKKNTYISKVIEKLSAPKDLQPHAKYSTVSKIWADRNTWRDGRFEQAPRRDINCDFAFPHLDWLLGVLINDHTQERKQRSVA